MGIAATTVERNTFPSGLYVCWYMVSLIGYPVQMNRMLHIQWAD